MSFRSVHLSDYLSYLKIAYPDGESLDRAQDAEEREIRLARFPHAVMLQVAFPELDFANR